MRKLCHDTKYCVTPNYIGGGGTGHENPTIDAFEFSFPTSTKNLITANACSPVQDRTDRFMN